MVDKDNLIKRFSEQLMSLKIGEQVAHPLSDSLERFIYKKLSSEETIERCKNSKDGNYYRCDNCNKWTKYEKQDKDDNDIRFYLCHDCCLEIKVISKDSGY